MISRVFQPHFLIKLENLLFFFRKQKPSIIMLTGDRSDTLAAALAATFNQIPIIHIHGGELSFGSIDEKFRHCISKNYLTFTSYLIKIIKDALYNWEKKRKY